MKVATAIFAHLVSFVVVLFALNFFIDVNLFFVLSVFVVFLLVNITNICVEKLFGVNVLKKLLP